MPFLVTADGKFLVTSDGKFLVGTDCGCCNPSNPTECGQCATGTNFPATLPVTISGISQLMRSDDHSIKTTTLYSPWSGPPKKDLDDGNGDFDFTQVGTCSWNLVWYPDGGSPIYQLGVSIVRGPYFFLGVEYYTDDDILIKVDVDFFGGTAEWTKILYSGYNTAPESCIANLPVTLDNTDILTSDAAGHPLVWVPDMYQVEMTIG